MRKSIIMIVIIALVVGGVAMVVTNSKDDNKNSIAQNTSSAVNDQTSSSSNSSSPVEAQNVDIKDMAFAPAKVLVKKGSTLTWKNQDSVNHSVVPDAESADFKPSNILESGGTYSATFNTVGKYAYHCGMHSSMTGSVEVVE